MTVDCGLSPLSFPKVDCRLSPNTILSYLSLIIPKNPKSIPIFEQINFEVIMKYSVDKNDNIAVFELQEERLNSANSPDLKSELLVLNAEGYKNLILNLEEVKYIDSSGLSAIIVGNRICKEADGTFVVCGLQDAVKKLLEISQLTSILNIVPTVDESQDYIKMEELERKLKG